MTMLEQMEPRRLMAAGDVDSTFAPVAANVTLPRADLHDAQSTDVAVDSAGRSVVFGNTKQTTSGGTRDVMFVARFNTDGSPDFTFGDYGVQLIDLAVGQDAKSVAIDAAGRINLAYDTAYLDGTMVQLAQLNRDGTLNRRFGQRGTLFPRFGPDSTVGDLTVDSQNNVLLSVTAANQIGVAKLTPSGRQHPDFGPRSTRFIPYTEFGTASSIVAQDERILVGATILSRKFATDFAAIALTPQGVPDKTFGRNGYATTDIARSEDRVDSMFVDSYGRIVVSGKRAVPGDVADVSVAAARFTSDGAIDTSFFRTGTADGNKWALGTGGYTSRYRTAFDADPFLMTEWDGIYVGFQPTDGSDVNFQRQSIFNVTFNGRSLPDLVTPPINESIGYVTNIAGDAETKVFLGQAPLPPTSLFVKRKEAVATWKAGESEVALATVWQTEASEAATVDANGRLVAVVASGDNERTFIRFNPDGSVDSDVPFRPFDQPEDWHQASTGGLREPRPYALSDGSVNVAWETVDYGSPDGVAFAGLKLSATGETINLGATSDETILTFPNFLPDGTYTWVDGDDGFNRWVNVVPPAGGGTAGHYSVSAPVLPEDDEMTASYAVRIDGSTDWFIALTGSRGYVARMRTDRSMNPSFGNDGIVRNLANLKPFWGQSTGKLLFTRTDAPGMFRLNADGTADTTFGEAGVMAADFDHYTLDNAGRIIAWRTLVGGVADGDIQIARFTPDGQYDTSFSGNGITIVDAKVNSSAQANVIVDAQDRLIVTAVKTSPTSVSWSAVRILG